MLSVRAIKALNQCDQLMLSRAKSTHEYHEMLLFVTYKTL